MHYLCIRKTKIEIGLKIRFKQDRLIIQQIWFRLIGRKTVSKEGTVMKKSS